MKLRNQLLALSFLALFIAAGVLLFRGWVLDRPFGVIVFISDAMVARQLAAARQFAGGADHRLALDEFPHTALVRNAARDFAVPDGAAAATALATGQRVDHRRLAVDAHGLPLRSLLELAKSRGRRAGLITTGQLTDPTPAAFYAHSADAADTATIAAQFAGAKLDLALGGGRAVFLPAKSGAPDWLAELRGQGRVLLATKADLENAASFHESAVVGFFAPGDLAFSDEIESGSQQPSLADMTRRAIEMLQTTARGYVLVVDAAGAARAAVANHGERTLRETLALDAAIATAAKYAGEDTLIIAVGRHAIGGFTLNGYPLRQDRGVALLGANASGHPSIAWATGPKGPPAPANETEPAAFQTPGALFTVEDVVAAARGPGAEKVRGFLDLTAIFALLKDAL